MVDIDDVIKQVNFGDHRLRGLRVAGGGQILAFPIDIDRRPYNTRTTVRVCDRYEMQKGFKRLLSGGGS